MRDEMFLEDPTFEAESSHSWLAWDSAKLVLEHDIAEKSRDVAVVRFTE